METVAQGATWTDTFGPLTDVAEVIVANDEAHITVTIYDANDIDRSSGALIEYVGSGIYRVSKAIPSDGALGWWAVVSVWNDGTNPAETFTGGFEVEAATATASPVTGLGDNTLRSLRRKVAKRIPGEQFLVLTATDGDTTTFRDTENLPGPNDAYKGSDLYLLTGLNAGKQRRLQSSVQATGQLNWASALPTAVLAGDTAELWNLRGIGVNAIQVNDAINDAIESLAKNVWIPVSATIATDFDQDTPTISIPATLTRGIYSVDWQDSVQDGIWQQLDGGGEVPRYGWWYDAANAVIQIDGYWRSMIHGRTIRVLGYGGTGTLSADTDTTPIDSEAIVTEAVANLLVANSSRNDDFERFQQRADAMAAARRPFAVGRKQPNTVVLGS